MAADWKTLKLEPSVHKMLKKAAVQYDKSIQVITEEAVKKYLEELEGANA